jgi:hypothetical protein
VALAWNLSRKPSPKGKSTVEPSGSPPTQEKIAELVKVRLIAAERHQHEVAWVVATLDRDQADGPHHVGVGDLDDTARGLHGIELQRLAAVSHHGVATGLQVQGDFTPEKKRGVEAAEQKIGIGDGRRAS